MTIKILFSIFCVMSVGVVFAQAAPPATPIDGGLSALLVAGGLYGVKKIRDGFKND